MTTVYTATYLVNRTLERPANPTPVAQAFFEARAKSGPDAFPLDGADDPAFFSAKHLNGPVTWGVCRTDVRNLVKPGDWVVFFSAERALGLMDYDYRFVASLQVADKHSGWDIPAQFDEYLNRLVSASSKDGARHQSEPALSKRDWHNDWLWRLSAGPQGRKALFEQHGKEGVVPDAYLQTADADGKNYVVFERNAGFIMERPPLVATRSSDALVETWVKSPEVYALRNAVFGDRGDGHYLRTTNKQQPHRHTRRVVENADTWIAGVRAAAQTLR